MTNKQLRRYEMLFRVMKFGAARQDRFPESSRVGEAFALVTTAVKQLEGRAVAQMLLKREGARARASARATLQRLLESISRTTSIIQANSPEVAHAFRLPEKKSAQTLLTAPRATAQHLEPVAARRRRHRGTAPGRDGGQPAERRRCGAGGVGARPPRRRVVTRRVGE